MRRLLTMSAVVINSVTSSILFSRGTKSCKHAKQALKRSLSQTSGPLACEYAAKGVPTVEGADDVTVDDETELEPTILRA